MAVSAVVAAAACRAASGSCGVGDPHTDEARSTASSLFVPMAFNPLLSKAVANKAVSLAQTALQNEAVRKQIREAPEAVSRWAKSLQQPDGSGGALANLARLDPTARFGEHGLERRFDALAENVAMVFPESDDPTRLSMLQAVHELRRALIIASPLPLLKRKKVHLRIDSELGALEQALIDAVLP